MNKEKRIGKVVHYFGKIHVAVIKLKDKLSAGDTILIRGGEREFSQKVVSMERDYTKLKTAKAKSEIGMKVKGKAREGDIVYKVSPEKKRKNVKTKKVSVKKKKISPKKKPSSKKKIIKRTPLKKRSTGKRSVARSHKKKR